MSIGCATVPYTYSKNIEVENTLKIRPNRSQIERGRPNKFLDASGWIWPGSLLSKLFLWNIKVDSHYIAEETENTLRQYLADNDLNNVKIRLNQYYPGDEWRRLFKNKSVGAGWRYTLGIISVTFYTILPQRFFGGDNYNPYTNTVSIYSDHGAIAVHEGGHSKDFAKKKYKGSYAAIYMVPFVSLYHEAKATNDALGYMRAESAIGDQKDAYKILYPAYATYIGSNIGDFLSAPYAYALQAGLMIPAHAVARIKAATLKEPELTDDIL